HGPGPGFLDVLLRDGGERGVAGAVKILEIGDPRQALALPEGAASCDLVFRRVESVSTAAPLDRRAGRESGGRAKQKLVRIRTFGSGDTFARSVRCGGKNPSAALSGLDRRQERLRQPAVQRLLARAGPDVLPCEKRQREETLERRRYRRRV